MYINIGIIEYKLAIPKVAINIIIYLDNYVYNGIQFRNF